MRDQCCHIALSETELAEKVTNSSKQVTDGFKIYNSVAAAVVEVYKETLPKDQREQVISKTKLDKMKRRLRMAITNQTKYFGKEWNYVEEE